MNYPAWAKVVTNIAQEVYGWNGTLAWASELKDVYSGEGTRDVAADLKEMPENYANPSRFYNPIWGSRDVVIVVNLIEGEGCALFYGDEVRARGVEFLSRDRNVRQKVLRIFEEVY